jgi:DHA3 family tetracycline resistance protein-like MFS transporter
MLAADLARGLAVAALAALSLSGALQLWHVVAIVGLYGAGTAFFNPAFDAVVPELLPPEALAAANALDQVVRPLAQRLAGPALGGALVAAAGPGTAFALDAASFAVSAGALLTMRPQRRDGHAPPASLGADLRAGLTYVAGRRWLWVTLAAAALAFLAFMGPAEVLLPYLVKDSLHGSAAQLGLVLAAGGVGSAGCALLLARGGLPRQGITFMYAAWTLATLAVAGYGLSTAIWQLMLASLAFNGLETAGTIVWATAKQRHVPAALLGRVSSLDWLISTGLLPLSYALTGPVSGAIGVRQTLIGAGVLGGLVTFAALYAPGVRAVEGAPPPGIELAASG